MILWNWSRSQWDSYTSVSAPVHNQLQVATVENSWCKCAILYNRVKYPFTRRFKDACLIIRKTNTLYQYQLVCARVFEEGEEELEEDLEGKILSDYICDNSLITHTDDELDFLVDPSINYHQVIGTDHVTFNWIDPVSTIFIPRDLIYTFNNQVQGFGYEFRTTARAVNKPMLDYFETKVLECMFERMYQKSSDLASVTDLESMKFMQVRLICMLSILIYLRPGVTKAVNNEPKTPVMKAKQPAAASNVRSIEGEALVDIITDLYLYDAEKQIFVLRAEKVHVEIVQVPNSYQFWLIVKGDTSEILSQPIEGGMNPYFSTEHQSFVWIYRDGKCIIIVYYC